MYVEVRILTNNDISQAITQLLKRHRPDMWSFETTYYSKNKLHVGDLVVVNIKRPKIAQNYSENRLALVSKCHQKNFLPKVLTKPIIAKINLNQNFKEEWQAQKTIYQLKY